MFSDGVFAIAATLLVIEVGVPVVGPGRLLDALQELIPSYAGYVVSFTVIGVLWVNHHATLDRVARVDRQFLFLNLALLGVVAFIPFPTALVAEYIKDGGSNARWATFTYAVVMLLSATVFACMWWYLSRHRNLLTDACEPHAPAVAVKCSLAGLQRGIRKSACRVRPTPSLGAGRCGTFVDFRMLIRYI